MLINTYLIYLGFSFLCLSMEKHYKAIFEKKIKKEFKYTINIIGSLILIISLALLIKDMGISLGITYWIGVSALLISVIALILTYATKQFIYISIFFLLLCIFNNFKIM